MLHSQLSTPINRTIRIRRIKLDDVRDQNIPMRAERERDLYVEVVVGEIESALRDLTLLAWRALDGAGEGWVGGREGGLPLVSTAESSSALSRTYSWVWD